MIINSFVKYLCINPSFKKNIFDDHISNLFRYIDPSKCGYFIEAGANDGKFFSYTYPLEKKYHWSGILIEPSIDALTKCKLNRSKKNIYVQSALVSDQYSSNTIKGDFDGNYMASPGGKRLRRESSSVTVPATTLAKIIEKYQLKKIDLLSLDVEGYELEVLQGLNFNKICPHFILVEVYSSDYKRIHSLLNKKGYSLIANITNYSKENNPLWDGTHNDYLFEHN